MFENSPLSIEQEVEGILNRDSLLRKLCRFRLPFTRSYYTKTTLSTQIASNKRSLIVDAVSKMLLDYENSSILTDPYGGILLNIKRGGIEEFTAPSPKYDAKLICIPGLLPLLSSIDTKLLKNCCWMVSKGLMSSLKDLNQFRLWSAFSSAHDSRNPPSDSKLFYLYSYPVYESNLLTDSYPAVFGNFRESLRTEYTTAIKITLADLDNGKVNVSVSFTQDHYLDRHDALKVLRVV